MEQYLVRCGCVQHFVRISDRSSIGIYLFNYSSDSNGIDRSNVRDTGVSFSRRRRCCYATTTATADAPARRTSIGAACHCSFPAGLVESQDMISQRNLPRLYLCPTTGSTGDPRRTGLRGSSAIYMRSSTRSCSMVWSSATATQQGGNRRGTVLARPLAGQVPPAVPPKSRAS